MSRYFLILLLGSFFCGSAFATAPNSAADPKLFKALENVFESNSISFKTCLENIQVLVKAAIQNRVDLSKADVVIFSAQGDFLRPKSNRWPQVPHYRFHVVLVKDGLVYDYAATDTNGKPVIYEMKDYFENLFPRNLASELAFRVIPALETLTPAHQKLKMDEYDTYSYIKRAWAESGDYYKNWRSLGTRMNYEEYTGQKAPVSCSRIYPAM